jgi:hypothetical protein
MALLKARDADLCEKDAKRRPSFFFNTFFLTKFKEEGVSSHDSSIFGPLCSIFRLGPHYWGGGTLRSWVNTHFLYHPSLPGFQALLTCAPVESLSVK